MHIINQQSNGPHNNCDDVYEFAFYSVVDPDLELRGGGIFLALKGGGGYGAPGPSPRSTIDTSMLKKTEPTVC